MDPLTGPSGIPPFAIRLLLWSRNRSTEGIATCTTIPMVSEAHEGKPWFEWCVLGVVAVITLLVAFGYTMAATVILAVTAIITGLVRLILQDKSPWKVRSVAFDSFIGIALGIGLLITYFSFFGLFGNIFFR